MSDSPNTRQTPADPGRNGVRERPPRDRDDQDRAGHTQPKPEEDQTMLSTTRPGEPGSATDNRGADNRGAVARAMTDRTGVHVRAAARRRPSQITAAEQPLMPAGGR